MRGYKPQTPYNVPMILQVPAWSKVDGVEKKTYNDATLFFGSFRTFGGTERDVNGRYSVENTAVVETWFRGDIKSDCRIKVIPTGEVYDVLGAPENINMQNQRMKFKVIAIEGGA